MALVLTAVPCFGLAAAAPWVVRYVARGLGPDVARSITLGALKSPWVLQPVFPDFSALSTSWLFIVMPSGFLLVTLATVLVSRGRFLSVRRVPVWRSATPGVHGEDSYNAFAYANPVRHVLANILGTQKEVALLEVGPPSPADGAPARGRQGEVATPDDGAADDEVTDDAVTDDAVTEDGVTEDGVTEEWDRPHVVFKASVAEPIETYLYRPVIAGYLAVARTAKRLQSGRLEAYVGYMLVALIVVLIVAAAMR
jgi:hypothetical protein